MTLNLSILSFNFIKFAMSHILRINQFNNMQLLHHQHIFELIKTSEYYNLGKYGNLIKNIVQQNINQVNIRLPHMTSKQILTKFF